MTPIETDVRDYLVWMRVHNYARTTIAGRVRYLSYLTRFLHEREIDDAGVVTLEVLLDYQLSLFTYRKRDGGPLSFSTVNGQVAVSAGGREKSPPLGPRFRLSSP